MLELRTPSQYELLQGNNLVMRLYSKYRVAPSLCGSIWDHFTAPHLNVVGLAWISDVSLLGCVDGFCHEIPLSLGAQRLWADQTSSAIHNATLLYGSFRGQSYSPIPKPSTLIFFYQALGRKRSKAPSQGRARRRLSSLIGCHQSLDISLTVVVSESS